GCAGFAAGSHRERADGAVAAVARRRRVATKGESDSATKGDLLFERCRKRSGSGDGRDVWLGNQAFGRAPAADSAASVEASGAKALTNLLACERPSALGRAQGLLGFFELSITAALEVGNRLRVFAVGGKSFAL